MSDKNGSGSYNQNGNYRGYSNQESHRVNESRDAFFQDGIPAAQYGPPHVPLRNKATEPLNPHIPVSEPEKTYFPSIMPLTPGAQVVLSGDLKSFSTSALLSLLNIQKQTGKLHMKNGSATGFIYMEKGEVFDAQLDNVTGALALFQLFGWRNGEFLFETKVPAPAKRTIEASLPVLQVRATLWLDNWNKFNPIIPTTAHRIGIAAEPRSEVMIEPYHWTILTRIVSAPVSITDLAAELQQDVMTITRIAADLVKMGVAVVYPPSK